MSVYYFAARFSRNAEMRRYRDQLQAAAPGAKVSSTWLDRRPDAWPADQLNTDPAPAWARDARPDLADINDADVFVQFTETPDAPAGPPSAGGRHVEFGYALARRDDDIYTIGVDPRRLVIVGPRENVFHAHPAVEVYADFAAFLAHEAGGA